MEKKSNICLLLDEGNFSHTYFTKTLNSRHAVYLPTFQLNVSLVSLMCAVKKCYLHLINKLSVR